jgi:hypothetical protein
LITRGRTFSLARAGLVRAKASAKGYPERQIAEQDSNDQAQSGSNADQ